MLKVGSNRYEMVDAHSRLSVTLYPPGDSVGGRQQVWQLKANFVPAETDYTPPTPRTDEYLELRVRAEFYQVKDWHKLSGFGYEDETDDALVLATLTNRLAEGSELKDLPIAVDEFKLEFVDDFIFRCHLEGVRELPDGSEQELKLHDLLTFSEVVAHVPINSADPVAAAKAMATKYINLKEFGESWVVPYDPKRPTRLKSLINSHHIVTLQTAWR